MTETFANEPGPAPDEFPAWIEQIANRISAGTEVLSAAMRAGLLRSEVQLILDRLRSDAARAYLDSCNRPEGSAVRFVGSPLPRLAELVGDHNLRANLMLLRGRRLELCLDDGHCAWSGSAPTAEEADVTFLFGEGNCGIAVMRAWDPTAKKIRATLSTKSEAGGWPPNLSNVQLNAISPELDWVMSAPVRPFGLPVGVVNLDGVRWRSLPSAVPASLAPTMDELIVPARGAIEEVLLRAADAVEAALQTHLKAGAT
jgi:hypothetical protein